MANSTDPFAQAVHGTNPQYLVEKITRLKIYNCVYWKEQCFGLTAATIIDKAVALKYCGGVYGGTLKPTNFLCLVLKMLQLQPEREIIIEFIKNDDFNEDIYKYLEPLYNDYRKISYRGVSGWQEIHMDEFVDSLLRDELVCDIALPHLIKRAKLEELMGLPVRKSVLEAELEDMGEILEPTEAKRPISVRKLSQSESASAPLTAKEDDVAIKFDDDDDDDENGENTAEVNDGSHIEHAVAMKVTGEVVPAAEIGNPLRDPQASKGPIQKQEDSLTMDDRRERSDDEGGRRRSDRRQEDSRERYRRREDREGRNQRRYEERQDERSYRRDDRERRRSRSRSVSFDRFHDRRSRSRSPDRRRRDRSKGRSRERERERERESDREWGSRRDRGSDRERDWDSRGRDSRNRDKDPEKARNVEGDASKSYGNPVEEAPRRRNDSAKNEATFHRMFGKNNVAAAGGKEIVNQKGEKVVINAPEGSVEYWNQIRESLGMKKLQP